MASYTRKYPNTNSTLTINYPDGLFSRIVEDPRTLYRLPQKEELSRTPFYRDNQGNIVYRTDKDYGRLAYPDLILIPANGSFIKILGMREERRIERKFRVDDNETWHLDYTMEPWQFNGE